MQLGIDPKVDYAFKHLFGRDATRPLLIDVLDSVLDPAPGHAIRDLDLLNPFNPKEALDDKLSILDINARDQSGRQFNVEMQMLAFRHFERRVLYYWSRLYQLQLHEGQDYLELKPTLSVTFLDHVLFPDAPTHHLRFRLLETERHFPFTGDLELHVLELPKFTKSAQELTSGLDVWLYFLRHAETIDPEALPAAMNRPLVRRALEELKMLSRTDEERERYEARRKWQLDYNTGMKAARLEGEEIGRARGEQIGRAQGEQIGPIRLCEGLLGRPETPAEQLVALSLEELTRRADELRALLQR
jgi:predicted transposase/invertase (TIGR01784 family)